jgi:peptidyl-prolyl cis-trans isomerase B (cyclophilin B)
MQPMETLAVQVLSTGGRRGAEDRARTTGARVTENHEYSQRLGKRFWPVAAAVLMFCALGKASWGQDAAEPEEYAGLDEAVVRVEPVKHTVQVGRPVWADFTICNPTDLPLKLQFGKAPEGVAPSEPTVLPLEHVFSGPGLDAVRVASTVDDSDVGSPTMMEDIVSYAAPIIIAPRGILGVRVNLAQYFMGLSQPGSFRLTWRPYAGAIESEPAKLFVTQLKQVVIDTKFGEMTVALEYEKAPNHVANFLELAESGFYNNKTFHMVIPGLLIHGGCPRGDGTGVRPDGKLLKAEFNDLPHKAGTVSMSRKPNDPDSASCQFFICVTRIRELDGQYTVFGHLVGQESFDTLQKISQVETDDRDRPLRPVYIRQMRVENAPSDYNDNQPIMLH